MGYRHMATAEHGDNEGQDVGGDHETDSEEQAEEEVADSFLHKRSPPLRLSRVSSWEVYSFRTKLGQRRSCLFHR